MAHEGLMPTRRDVLAGAAAVALAGAPALAQTVAATARGTVFDADSSPRKGVPDVMVSNGLEVVKTAADGSWFLPLRDGDSVFVIKPAGWALPVDPETNLPHYAYVHSPHGSPNLGFRFAGLAPTGPLPDSIDFPLHRVQEPARFDAVLFTDPQPESLHELGYVRDDVVSVVDPSTAAFGITTGDIMFDDLSYYPRYNRIVGTIGLPWFNCRGNHDMNLEAPDNTHAAETFKRVYGARWRAFQYSGTTFILLDNVDYLGTDPSRPNGFGKYRGFFGERQLGFIRNVLANVPRDSLVVICFHIPLKTLAASDAANNTVDIKEFLAAIGTHSNTVSFCGHTHTNEHWYFTAADGYAAVGQQGGTHHHHIMAAVSGSWWSGPFDARGIPMALQSDGTPNGFHILSVDGSGYTTTLVPAHDPSRGQMRVMLDSQLHAPNAEVIRDYHTGALLTSPISVDALGSTRLVVNLFDGGPRSKVEVSLAGRPYKALAKVERLDPFVVEVYDRNADTKKPWVQAGKSTHIWQDTLPVDLGAGTHKVAVRATDEHGRVHTASMVLEVTA
ncbi:MAG TPA: calcineurin-like phosphoesterase family protein [Rhodopila sp.]|nr:calcineurin-like phosphoesterase family protein [Rhodopila sp.]